MDTPEFKINDTVTVDRYNHIKDVQKGAVVGFGTMPISKRLTYKVDINGVVIQTTGGSIVESKNYEPVPRNERHEPFGSREYREREVLEDAAWFKRTKMK